MTFETNKNETNEITVQSEVGKTMALSKETNSKNKIFLISSSFILIFLAVKFGKTTDDILAKAYLFHFIVFNSVLKKYIELKADKISGSMLKDAIKITYMLFIAIGITIFFKQIADYIPNLKLPNNFEFISLSTLFVCALAIEGSNKGIIETSLIYAVLMTFGSEFEEYSTKIIQFALPAMLFLSLVKLENNFKAPDSK